MQRWGSDQVLRSMEYERADDEARADATRCLPYHAVSVFALVVLLTRWAGTNPRQGGMRDSNHRVASQHLLEGLIMAACSGDALVIMLLVDDAFQWRPPRPPRGENPFAMRVQVVMRGGGGRCLCVRVETSEA